MCIRDSYTGEVSFEMVKDAGCQYVIIGHSERRALFGETNRMVNKKIVCAVKNEIGVIFCVGENEEERNKGKTFEILENQVCQGLSSLTKKNLNKIKVFCDINLGKSVIETKDTPGFIGNRIGVFWIERAAAEAINYKLTVEETDAIIIVVSEETAQVAVARDGMLEQAVSVDRLREIVSGLGSEGDVNTASGTGVTSPALAGG